MTTNDPAGGTDPTADTDGGDTAPGGSPYDGPRVTRDEVKDLGRLRRSSTDKKVAGVAAGIARHLDIDPLVVRIAFVVLAFFGGGGILLYAACWLFVPDEHTHQAVVNVDDRSRTVILAIAGVLAALAAVGDTIGGLGFPWPLAVVGGIVIVYALSRNSSQRSHPGPVPGPHPTPSEGASIPEGATVPRPPGSGGPHGTAYAGYQPPPPRPVDPTKRGPILFWFTMALAALGVGAVLMLELAGWDVPPAAYPAVVMAICGVMLLWGAFHGRAGGLIAVGLVAALMTGALSAVPHLPDHRLSMGQTHVSPDRLSDLSEGYAVGLGEIRIDLTETDLDGARDETLNLDVGAGHIQVLVPEEGLAVEVNADIGVGEVVIFDDKYTGSVTDERWGDEGDPVLTINAEAGAGNIEIEHKEAA